MLVIHLTSSFSFYWTLLHAKLVLAHIICDHPLEFLHCLRIYMVSHFTASSHIVFKLLVLLSMASFITIINGCLPSQHQITYLTFFGESQISIISHELTMNHFHIMSHVLYLLHLTVHYNTQFYWIMSLTDIDLIHLNVLFLFFPSF